MNYTCHSGGCPGADMEWENEGLKYGVTTIAYSFPNHILESKNPKILSVKELNEGWDHVKIADQTLKTTVDKLSSTYTRSLLCRNWFQVKNSDVIFAVGKFNTLDKSESGMYGFAIVAGGTGWAIQMAIDNKKPIYFFDQTSPLCDLGGPKLWNYFDYDVNIFVPLTITPILKENFAGIGTRDLNEYGKLAIREVYRLALS